MTGQRLYNAFAEETAEIDRWQWDRLTARDSNGVPLTQFANRQPRHWKWLKDEERQFWNALGRRLSK